MRLEAASSLPLYVKCMTPNNGLDSDVENSRFARLPNDGQPKRWTDVRHSTVCRSVEVLILLVRQP